MRHSERQTPALRGGLFLNNNGSPRKAGITVLCFLLLTACTASAIPQIGNNAINTELCAQYSREVPYDAERAKIVARQVELYCD